MTAAPIAYGLLACAGVALVLDGLSRMMLANDRSQAEQDLEIEQPEPPCESHLERAAWIVLLILMAAVVFTTDLDRRGEGTPLTRAETTESQPGSPK